MTRKIYVVELSETEQNEIESKIRKLLTSEGLTKDEIEEAIQNALDSKIADIQHVL
ncbi:hypothetical protein [Bacillus sp. FJAT-26390]|uniref:hypothetical protein n=1 Tax=Bacillus sp. FJAT-26390 TaxID=1743142 RepID=UPI00159EF4E7|nr:hypothetical protein [Bacillus sp. FJAT-26390]